jgi:GTP cyclohydrolase I
MNIVQQRKLKEIASALNQKLNDSELFMVMSGYNTCIERLVRESESNNNK